jgi:adenylate cyclase
MCMAGGLTLLRALSPLAGAGGICVSMDVERQIRNSLEARFEKLAPTELKNISVAMDLFRIVLPWERRPKAETTSKNAATALVGPGKWKLWVGILVLLSAALFAGYLLFFHRAGRHAIHSIAVLPLDNYSGDPSQDYFAEGMTDELTTDLATISRLRVISRSSTTQFTGGHRPSTPEIARMLDVDAVVEGSVRRSGDKVRITAQLIDARADRHLWAKSFERDSRDVLAMQSELASAIASEINVELTPSEQARLTSARPVNPEAYDAYLKGRYFFNRPSDENLNKAITRFEEGVRLDPNRPQSELRVRARSVRPNFDLPGPSRRSRDRGAQRRAA